MGLSLFPAPSREFVISKGLRNGKSLSLWIIVTVWEGSNLTSCTVCYLKARDYCCHVPCEVVLFKTTTKMHIWTSNYN